MILSKALKSITILYNNNKTQIMLRLMSKKWANLPNIFKYGVVTNTVFSVFLRITADGTQQNIEKKTILKYEEYDFKRLKSVTSIGIVLGPGVYYWYKYLDFLLPGKTIAIISKKILLDQIIAGTLFTFVFITGLCLLEGQNMTDSLAEFMRKFPFVYLVDWIVWPPVQYLNFYLVPTQYRAAFVNIALFCWNVFLSFMKFDH